MSAQAKRLVGATRRPRPQLRKQSERGAAAVEFAIVLSLLLMFVFGTIQFGIAFNRNQGLQAAAREGARTASVGGTQANVASRVRQAQSLFTSSDIQVRIESSTDHGVTYPNTICDDATSGKCVATSGQTPCGEAGIGSLVKVTATVPAMAKYAIFIPVWGNHHVRFSSIGVFRCEQLS